MKSTFPKFHLNETKVSENSTSMKPKFPNFHLNEINEGVGVDFLQKKDIPHVHIYVHVRIDCFLVGGGGYFTQDTPKYGPS